MVLVRQLRDGLNVTLDGSVLKSGSKGKPSLLEHYGHHRLRFHSCTGAIKSPTAPNRFRKTSGTGTAGAEQFSGSETPAPHDEIVVEVKMVTFQNFTTRSDLIKFGRARPVITSISSQDPSFHRPIVLILTSGWRGTRSTSHELRICALPERLGMPEHDLLATIKRGEQIDSVQTIDSSAQIRGP